MPTQVAATTLGLAGHGAGRLTAVHTDTYNAKLRDEDGFISGQAFRAILEDGCERVRQIDDDPLGDIASTVISKKKLDHVMMDGDPEAERWTTYRTTGFGRLTFGGTRTINRTVRARSSA